MSILTVSDRSKALLPKTTIGAAVTGIVGRPVAIPRAATALTVILDFLYGAGGTDVTIHVQTTFDGGLTWVDIMAFNMLVTAGKRISSVRRDVAVSAAITPTDGALADNTILDGLIGTHVRAKYTTTGTYTGATSIKLDLVYN